MIALLATAFLAFAAADPVTWIAPVMTTIAAIAAGYFARQSQRDKFAFDFEVSQMRQEIVELRGDVAECRMERDTLRATNDRQQLEIDALREELRELKNPPAASAPTPAAA